MHRDEAEKIQFHGSTRIPQKRHSEKTLTRSKRRALSNASAHSSGGVAISFFKAPLSAAAEHLFLIKKRKNFLRQSLVMGSTFYVNYFIKPDELCQG